MSHDMRQAILAYLRSVGGSATYADLMTHIKKCPMPEDASIGVVEALLEMTNDGTVEAGVYFTRRGKEYHTGFQRDMAPAAILACAEGTWVTADQIARCISMSPQEVSMHVHHLWWDGYLRRDYRYAIASYLPSFPQESAQNDDTTPPPPAA